MIIFSVEEYLKILHVSIVFSGFFALKLLSVDPCKSLPFYSFCLLLLFAVHNDVRLWYQTSLKLCHFSKWECRNCTQNTSVMAFVFYMLYYY